MAKRSMRNPDDGGASSAAAATTLGMPTAPDPRTVHERGAFAFGSCERCGWQGPARRSRERARKDLRRHLEDKPKHADHVGLGELPH